MCARQNGPDWMDILSQLKVLEETHDCVGVIHMWSDGLSKGGQLYVCVSAHPQKGLLELMSEAPAVWENWPDRTSKTVPDLLGRLLFELDYKLTKAGGKW